MTPELRATYSRCLRAYPKPWREANGEVLLDTLDEAVGPDVSRPDWREVRSLISNGWRTRVTSTCGSPGAAIREGMVWGVLATQAVGPSLSVVGGFWFVAAVLIIAFPNRLTAVAYGVVAVAAEVYWYVSFRQPVQDGSPGFWARSSVPTLIEGLVVGTAMAVVLFLGARRPSSARRHRSWWWIALPVIALFGGPFKEIYVTTVMVSFVLLVVGLFGLARLDPRLPAAGFVPVAMFAIRQATMRTFLESARWYTLGRSLAVIVLLSWASLAAMRRLGVRAFRT